ncbi:AAA family ATPase [Bosea sp. PAMC 26642]|uniref:AAA family ATPase n=1 Tax=Bosea sp. (strain PAMC 26642) TaxID=1792307 RepID=UPI00076FEDCD|nr:DNA-binding protein [Bosea sp. PAMC 26642]AMJ61146.1 DNA-binding protein [Bosea sp. PAMC 26642]
MKLTALRLHNVRRFAGRGVAVEGIGDGVNVLCAVNEFGKSTCFDALHALFFQPHSGTPGAVQALRPYSGGSPLVEADIATADGPFRLTKQFYGGKRAMVREIGSGRLIAQADEAERFIASLVQGGTAGPAGLLWVRQGVTGIERRAKSDEDGEKRARESVLTSVQGEVESLTGGRRMAQALAACEEELSRLVTGSGRPKTGGAYAQALDERERLTETERQLASEMRDLRDALDKRRAVKTALAELENPDEDAARHGALKQAQADWETASAHGDALKTAQAQAALARNRRDAAALIHENYRQGLARFAALRDLESDATGRRDLALERQGETARASQAAAEAVEAAEREEREARDLLARLDKALRARAASASLAALQATNAQAQAARMEIETIEAELKALALPPATLREIAALETDIVGLRAVAAMRAPLVRVAYRDGVTGAVSLDGTTFADGEEKPLTAGSALEIAGIGSVTLRLQQGGSGHDKLAATEAKRAALLASLGVENLAEAHRRATTAGERKTTLELAKQRLALLAPTGLLAQREEIARLSAESAGAIEIKADPVTAGAALAAAEARVTASRNAAREAQPLRAAADSGFVEAQTALVAAQSELASLGAALGAEAGRAAREAELASALAMAEQEFATAQQRVEALQAGAADLASAQAKLARMKSVIEASRARTAALREDLAGLNGQIRVRADEAVEEAWQEAAEKLAEAGERVARFEREVALLTRLRAVLEAAQADARDHYFAPVMRELRPLLGLLFEDATVTFDEETLLPKTVRRNGLEEPVGVLSGGMREQLAVLTRLAFARLLAGGGQPAPVILDDALVFSDDDRIERMFDALHRQASNQQIIVFSCRQRAFAQLGGNILQMIPWAPEP